MRTRHVHACARVAPARARSRATEFNLAMGVRNWSVYLCVALIASLIIAEEARDWAKLVHVLTDGHALHRISSSSSHAARSSAGGYHPGRTLPVATMIDF